MVMKAATKGEYINEKRYGIRRMKDREKPGLKTMNSVQEAVCLWRRHEL